MTAAAAFYGLLGILAIALLAAALSDLRRREIDNELTGGLALLAVPFWWASGLSLWPGAAVQVAFALAIFLMLAGLFALGAMGGGDVKLLAALALWLPWRLYLQLSLVTALLGGVLALAWACRHRLAQRAEPLEIPYGVAIAGAGWWVLGSEMLLGAGRTR
jgi:prepilin peptidase CpaA